MAEMKSTAPPATALRIEPATASDLPACMAIRVPAFCNSPLDETLYGADSPSTREAACIRHKAAWEKHEASEGPNTMKPIKAVYTDPTTGEETIVGFAEWYFYPTVPRPGTVRPVHPLVDPDSHSVDKQQVAHQWLDPVNDARQEFMGDKPMALLMYMCIDPKWRRKGASTLCVKWGMDKCDELGTPGWLEASEEGKFVYGKLGWEVLGTIKSGSMEFPGMVYWPKGWKGPRT